MRTQWIVIGLSLSAACNAQTIDLGADGGAATTTAALATCSTASETSATLGNGYSNQIPSEACTATPAGVSPASVTAANAAVVGLWSDCTGGSFGITMADPYVVKAIELTADGQYVAYGAGDDDTLVPFSAIPQPEDAGPIATAAATGTYTVVDGSATYGAGTFELQLHPANGGLFQGEIQLASGPKQLLYFPANGPEQIFSPPLPWSARKGVCTCLDTTGAGEAEEASAMETAIVGKWVWCAGGAGFPIGNVGVEFAAGNTWYGLDEDQSGAVARSTRSDESGTFTVVASSVIVGAEPSVNRAPLAIELTSSTSKSYLPARYFSDPRALVFDNGVVGYVGGSMVSGQSVCLPMP